jgi:hypothetical protein
VLDVPSKEISQVFGTRHASAQSIHSVDGLKGERQQGEKQAPSIRRYTSVAEYDLNTVIQDPRLTQCKHKLQTMGY